MITLELQEKLVQYQADVLAELHGLNKPRVRKLFMKWWESDKTNLPLIESALLDKVCSMINPSKALSLVESQILDDLKYKDGFVEGIMNSPYTPLLTIEELAEVTEEFLAFQESNRDHLIETGFPKAIFNRSQWFDLHLSRLNYVKLPVDLPNISGRPKLYFDKFENRLTASQNGNGRPQCNSLWIKEPLAIQSEYEKMAWPKRICRETYLHCYMNYEMRDGRLYDSQGKEVEICSYKEAPVIDWIDSRMASRLEQLRETLFAVRIDILGHLLSLASKKVLITDTLGEWSECLCIISGKLTNEEAAYLVDAGKHLACSSGRVTKGSLYPKIILFHFNSGLREVLFAAEHLLQELAIGTMSKTRVVLNSIKPHLKITSYYEAIDEPWRADLEQAICKFEDLAKQRSAFLRELDKIFDSAIRGEMPVRATLTSEVPWSAKNMYFSLMSAISNSVIECIRREDILPARSLAAWRSIQEPVSLNSPGKNSKIDKGTAEKGEKSSAFKHSDDYRSIKWRGEQYVLPPNAAAAVKLMHEAYEEGSFELSKDYILERIDSNAKRFQDVFRTTGLWGKLVVKGKRRDTYKLNLP